ncbi:siderophore ABC transporter substrate-binding protein [Paenochrobactrum sp. BZR 588]|uniref:siderophore ABC transporter substrate-binding protein n=2 Tax=Brucellaceae TaxID=118882 RepID=UPI0035BC315A
MTIGTRLSTLFGAAIVAMSLGAAAQAEEITIKHVQGETSVPVKPAKTITFDLATLDNLDRLGVDIVGLPTANLPKYLSKYSADSYAKVGTLFEPDYEAVNAAAPDLIIVSGRSAPKQPELAKIAPTIDLTVNATNFIADVKNNVETLGRIYGKEDAAKDEIAKLDASIAVLKEKVAGKGKGLLVMTSGGKMSAYGPGSRFGMLHSEFGVEPADPELSVGSHGQPISAEYILEKNPDWLLVIDRDAAVGAKEGNAASKVLDNDLVNQTTAWKNDQVIYLDPMNWYLVGGGLSGLHETIDQLSAAFDKAK